MEQETFIARVDRQLRELEQEYLNLDNDEAATGEGLTFNNNNNLVSTSPSEVDRFEMPLATNTSSRSPAFPSMLLDPTAALSQEAPPGTGAMITAIMDLRTTVGGLVTLTKDQGDRLAAQDKAVTDLTTENIVLRSSNALRDNEQETLSDTVKQFKAVLDTLRASTSQDHNTLLVEAAMLRDKNNQSFCGDNLRHDSNFATRIKEVYEQLTAQTTSNGQFNAQNATPHGCGVRPYPGSVAPRGMYGLHSTPVPIPTGYANYVNHPFHPNINITGHPYCMADAGTANLNLGNYYYPRANGVNGMARASKRTPLENVEQSSDPSSNNTDTQAAVNGDEDSGAANLCIGNVSRNVDADWLAREFEVFGALNRVRIVDDRMSSMIRRYGYVEFTTAANARRALDAKNGSRIDGCTVYVNYVGKLDSMHSNSTDIRTTLNKWKAPEVVVKSLRDPSKSHSAEEEVKTNAERMDNPVRKTEDLARDQALIKSELTAVKSSVEKLTKELTTYNDKVQDILLDLKKAFDLNNTELERDIPLLDSVLSDDDSDKELERIMSLIRSQQKSIFSPEALDQQMTTLKSEIDKIMKEGKDSLRVNAEGNPTSKEDGRADYQEKMTTLKDPFLEALMVKEPREPTNATSMQPQSTSAGGQVSAINGTENGNIGIRSTLRSHGDTGNTVDPMNLDIAKYIETGVIQAIQRRTPVVAPTVPHATVTDGASDSD